MTTRGERSMVAQVPLEVFFATITDYTAYPRILEDIKTAEVVTREGNVVVVAYTLKVLLKAFDYTLRMVEERPNALSWSLVSSSSLKQNDGGWRLEALAPKLTRVTYWNELAARSFLPKSFINGLARIALPSMLRRWAAYAAERSDL